MYCPIDDCTWTCLDKTWDVRKKLLTDHLNEAGAHARQAEEVEVNGHNLFMCEYCKVVFNVDPTKSHQETRCDGVGAPRVAKEQRSSWSSERSNARAREFTKICDDARCVLWDRHHRNAVPVTRREDPGYHAVTPRATPASTALPHARSRLAGRATPGSGSVAASPRDPVRVATSGDIRRHFSGVPRAAQMDARARPPAVALDATEHARSDSSTSPIDDSMIDLRLRQLTPVQLALVTLVRRNHLDLKSVELVSARGSQLSSIGKAQAAVAQRAINPIVDMVAADISRGEAWTCLFVMMQLMMEQPSAMEKMEGEVLQKRITAELKERVATVEAGQVQAMWDKHLTRLKLPTTESWERQRRASASQQREAIGREAIRAVDGCDIKSGNKAIAAGVSAPPGDREFKILQGLLPVKDGVERSHMEAHFKAMRFDKPQEAASALHARLAVAKERLANTAKWTAILGNAKTRKQPCGTGWRTEFTKRLSSWNMEAWAILFEGIEQRAVPASVRILITSPLVIQILKRDAMRRFSIWSKTRPIGLTCSLTQDSLRPWARRASKVLALILSKYGQVAVGVLAGGESAQTAAQARCDMSKWTVTIAIDQKNAFPLVENGLTLLALRACIRVIKHDAVVKAALADAKVDVKEAILVMEFLIDDLVWTRTYHFEYITVVEGGIRRLTSNVGETQGGLFSALRYVVAKAFAVDRPLNDEFPDMVLRSIVDDGIMQMEVTCAADVDRLVKWMWRLDKLVRGDDRPVHRDADGTYCVTGVMGELNFDKFKILQHPDARDSVADVRKACASMPSCMVEENGQLVAKHPTVIHDILEFNGVAIGFDDKARRDHVDHEVDLLEERVARLMDISGIIGRQRTEIYGRASYRASSVLIHQMRASPPAIAMPAMARATQLQLRLFRHITGATVEMVGGVMEEWGEVASPPACSSRCSLSVHLPSVMGGHNWPEPRLIQPFLNAAKVIATYNTVKAMRDMSEYPAPAAWATCDVRELRAAAATIEKLAGMEAFHTQPPGDAEAWKRLHRTLIGPDRSIMWENVVKISKMQFQRVATRAHSLELMHRALRNDGVHMLTKVRMFAAAQPGSGEWCCLMGIPNKWVRLDDAAFQRASFARIGHPDPMILNVTRCRCADYSQIPAIPGPNMGLVSKPWVSGVEHGLGVHWHQCVKGGMSTAGHNAVSYAWLRALKKLGYTGEVSEVPLGLSDKGTNVKADGVAKNFAVSGAVLVWDSRISSSYLSSCRALAKEKMYVVTDTNERLKDNEKGTVCEKYLGGRAVFLPLVCNSHGGLGRLAWQWLQDAFRRKRDEGEAEVRHMVRLEFETAVAEIACAVLNRNAMIMAANAHPVASGTALPVADVLWDARCDEVMHGGV